MIQCPRNGYRATRECEISWDSVQSLIGTEIPLPIHKIPSDPILATLDRIGDSSDVELKDRYAFRQLCVRDA